MCSKTSFLPRALRRIIIKGLSDLQAILVPAATVRTTAEHVDDLPTSALQVQEPQILIPAIQEVLEEIEGVEVSERVTFTPTLMTRTQIPPAMQNFLRDVEALQDGDYVEIDQSDLVAQGEYISGDYLELQESRDERISSDSHPNPNYNTNPRAKLTILNRRNLNIASDNDPDTQDLNFPQKVGQTL
eukprot:m.56041 g.56041  ORF g.56041 m.56041 type:complete len:187 (-) comp22171_c1_seq2:239-799(-)